MKTTLALFALACLAGTARAKTVDISVVNVAFNHAGDAPNAPVTINVGDTVSWHLVSGGHTVTSGTVDAGGKHPDGKFNLSLFASGATVTYTFTSAGTFPYYCDPHATCCQMKSSIIVTAPTPKKGDLNGDGKVDTADAALAVQILAGLSALPSGGLAVADVYPAGAPDGVFDVSDAAHLMRFVAGVDTAL